MSSALPVIDWRTDYERALAEARRRDRLVAALFWLDGRPLYRAMDQETFSDPRVARLAAERFVNVRVDIRLRPELYERSIGGRGGLGGAVLDPSGDVVSAFAGFLAPEPYAGYLERALSGYRGLRAARQTARAAPRDPAARLRLAEAYDALASPRRAEEEFETLIRLGSSGPATLARYAAHGHERLARYRALRGKNLEATAHLESYRRLDPADRAGRRDRALVTEAIVAWIERRFRDADRILEDGLRRYPASAERDRMLLVLATVRHENGDDVRALALLERLLREHPRSTVLAQAREQIAHIKNPPAEHTH